MSTNKALRYTTITRINSQSSDRQLDALAVEEPLEIRVGGRPIAVVMRTPGHDRELAAGFLVSEGLLRRRDDLLDLVYCTGDGAPADENRLDCIVAPGVGVNLAALSRNIFTSSSCGLCSRTAIDALAGEFPRLTAPIHPRYDVISGLVAKAEAAQATFASTGGLHASSLFTTAGDWLVTREDVGRHNALDKVVGHAFLADQLPLVDRILLVSGRVSFEIMQKGLAAGIACVAALSAPTTAAVEFAQASGQTLIGFLRPEGSDSSHARMNVYAGAVA